ncbi:AzlC family ABC transporter permease [Candidatus Stoquefichus sp. SB1]|uniref:AzlC family ABC transporter permease n=1 Tax=Candidatus Stoquefichus sp. SB1 TaxID=1658109 RepID=UPI00067F2511|nr:AzlC family ABC transporter permease [Candidatus Stoquefichus sp. SB1]
MNEFIGGCKKGMPIALGYFPVAFSFGVLVASSGLPLGLATLISLTNLTSSGQFAGISLILANASYLEIAATLLMINARYFLMSLSLSQKIDQNMNTLQRMIISFGITDETFGIASIQQETLTFRFMLGFILLPIIGWTSGTLVGETLMNVLPPVLQSAMGIALYGMFLAIIIPASGKSRAILEVVMISAFVSIIFYYVSFFDDMSSGLKLILATMTGAVYGAWRYPLKEECRDE